jgi:hypothetical protein
MALLHVEKIGGLAGFGAIGAKIRSHGHLDTAAISSAEQQAVEGLFQSRDKTKPSHVRDGFRYRITRTIGSDAETIEVPEELVPRVVAQCVKDELI